MVESILEIVS